MTQPHTSTPPDPGARMTPPAHDVRLLLGGGTQAQMILDGTVYVLRITRSGKLILTK